MSATGALVKLSPRDYDAVLFDLDGVLTPTAKVQAAAWKRLFDGFLSRRARQSGESFPVFMPPQSVCLSLSCADDDVRLDAQADRGSSFPQTDVHAWTRECSWPHSHRGRVRFHMPHKSILLQRAVLDPAGRYAPRIANTLASCIVR
jgi:hypothetical protein